MSTAHARREGGWVSGLVQLIQASGPDAESFLQGQLSQDLATIPPGASAPSLLLNPNGKIAAWLGVTRDQPIQEEPAGFWLLVDAGWAEAAVTRLERFKLRTACDLVIRPEVSITAFGPGASGLGANRSIPAITEDWAGLVTTTVFVTDPVQVGPTGTELDLDTVTALRIEAGRPAMGRELDESTIPAAAGIVEESVSFSKGCYTGQELVARVDSRGNNVPTRLVGLVAHGPVPPDTAIVHEGAEVGRVTSTGYSAELDRPVAMGYLRRAVATDSRVLVGDVVAQAVELPLVGR